MTGVQTCALPICREFDVAAVRSDSFGCVDQAVARANEQRDRLFAARGLMEDYRSAQVSR